MNKLKNIIPEEINHDKINSRKFRGIILKVIVGYGIVAVLFFIAVNIAQKKLSQLSETVTTILEPNIKLLKLKEISNSLYNAEANVKAYTIRRDTAYLVSYEYYINYLNTQLDTLLWLSANGVNTDRNSAKDKRKFSAQIDTLRELIIGRVELFNEYIELKTEENSSDALLQLAQKIKIEKPVKKSIPEIKSIPVKKSIPEKKTETPKKSFFSRLFSSKKKKEEVSEEVSEEISDEVSDVVLPRVSLDSIQRNFLKTITQAQQEEKTKEGRQLSTEIDITQREQLMMNQVFLLLSSMEEKELVEGIKGIQIATKETTTEISFISNWLTTIGLILALIFSYIIYRDILKARSFREQLFQAKLNAERLTSQIAEEAKRKAENDKQIAEMAVKAKQQFLSNMSHEIRTPMTAIIGFTKVILKTDLSEKQKEYLTAIKISGDALLVLINDILDLAKVNAGKISFEHTPFKMAESISAMLFLFETKVQEKDLELVKAFDNKIPSILVGDSARLHQIVLNLLSNALKFTTKGKITIGVHLLQEDEEKVTIEFAVTDTGIGIPESVISTIFEKFEQATSSTTRLYGGTGLGLAIVKQLVELQGGSINVKSKINEGSTFSFILSFQKTTDEPDPESYREETGLMDVKMKGIKVLVAEDNVLNQLLIRTILDDFGFERDIASNGKIAIEKLQTKSYDIILMDLQMPEMGGFEAAEYIRNKMKSQIPIIALTADVTSVDVEKCRVIGINDYISKPIDEKLLYSKIIELVKKPGIIV